MAKPPEQLVTQSVLDRLAATEEWPTTRAQSIRMLRDSIRRNLEWVLNTRRPPIEGIEEYPAARKSVIHYGLMDLGSMSATSSRDQQQLQSMMLEIVESCEPRLRDIQLTLDTAELSRHRLRFQIHASMQLRPMPEEIAFDTVLDLATGEYRVA